MATIYYVIYPSALGDPSAVQVSTGKDATGAAAVAAGSETARTTTGQQVFSSPATGLTNNTSYKAAYVWSDGTSYSNVAVSQAWRTGALFSSTLPAVLTMSAKLRAAAGGSLLQADLVSVATVQGSLLTGIRLSVNLQATTTMEVITKPPEQISANLVAQTTMTGRFARYLPPGNGVVVPADIMRVVVDVWSEERS